MIFRLFLLWQESEFINFQVQISILNYPVAIHILSSLILQIYRDFFYVLFSDHVRGRRYGASYSRRAVPGSESQFAEREVINTLQ